MDQKSKEFHAYDYAVFGASLGISLIIGLVFFIMDCRNRELQNPREFLLGGQRMNSVAVGLSMLGSVLNGVLLLGFPIEIYYYNTQFAFSDISFAISVVITAHVFIPFYRRFKNISCHEYLEKRFDSVTVRVLAALVFTVASILFLAVVIYTPALAIMQVTGLDKTISICACGVVCLLYVAMGGMKAVVWTDAVQILIIVAGMLTLTIMGVNRAGGAQEVWDHAVANDRVQFGIFDPHPFTRTTFWTQVVGLMFAWMPLFAANQMVIQRFHAVRTNREAQISMYISLAVVTVVVCLVTMLALTMYKFYAHADPRICNMIQKPDQLVPYFLMEVMGDYHGLPGLFVAAVFAAALSSVSSAVHSLAAVVLEDFVRPLVRCCGKEELSNGARLRIARALSVFFGLVAIGISFATEHMGELVVQFQLQIYGTVLAPLFGVFFMAAFVPCANAWGAVIGLLTSLLFNFWLSIGHILYVGRPRPFPPIGTNCSANAPPISWTSPDYQSTAFPQSEYTTFDWTGASDAFSTAAVASPSAQAPEEFSDFFRISYAWFGILGFLVCVVVGILVSLIASGLKGCCDKDKHDSREYLWYNKNICCGSGEGKDDDDDIDSKEHVNGSYSTTKI